MGEHEEDDRLAVRVGGGHRLGQPGARHELAGRGGGGRGRNGCGPWRRRGGRGRRRRGRGAGDGGSRRAGGWRRSGRGGRRSGAGRRATALVHHPGDEQEQDHHREHSERGDLNDRVLVQRLSHEIAPVTIPGRWTGKRKGPNLPTPLGLRTLLRRWASTGRAKSGSPETDSQANCAGSQLERLSNKLEPCVTIAVTR